MTEFQPYSYSRAAIDFIKNTCYFDIRVNRKNQGGEIEMEGILTGNEHPVARLHSMLEERECIEAKRLRGGVMRKAAYFVRLKLGLIGIRSHAERAARIGTEGAASQRELVLLRARLARNAGMLCGRRKAEALKKSLEGLRQSDPDGEILYCLAEAELHGLTSGILMERGSYNKAERRLCADATNENAVPPAIRLLFYSAFARLEESDGRNALAKQKRKLASDLILQHPEVASRLKKDPLFRFLCECRL